MQIENWLIYCIVPVKKKTVDGLLFWGILIELKNAIGLKSKGVMGEHTFWSMFSDELLQIFKQKKKKWAVKDLLKLMW